MDDGIPEVHWGATPVKGKETAGLGGEAIGS